MNPLLTLRKLGQSIWLDYVRRGLLQGGGLERLIAEDGITGVTSNPAIFEQAIAGSDDYAPALRALAREPGIGAEAAYEQLALDDIRRAADLLTPVFESTNRRDGYVSLEVSPHIAFDVARTCGEARRLWGAINRENVMIKVPATAQGVRCIERLIGESINVNATLLFARDRYEEVARAYLNGLERLAAGGGDVARVASVASFFVSRIDTAADRLLEQRSPEARERLRGKAAIANARLAYQRYRSIFAGPRWQALEARGAAAQRLLWASTSTKDPAYRDVLYVEELIGPDTINTLPPATLDAFRDHGEPRPSLEQDLRGAEALFEELEALGIAFDTLTDQLLKDGVRLFEEAYDKLLAAVNSALQAAA